jgi:hypothetical protein
VTSSGNEGCFRKTFATLEAYMDFFFSSSSEGMWLGMLWSAKRLQFLKKELMQ